ncbi:MAG: hypothetical protein JXN60_03275 [Lentisphaerae bacterium]|nr:hypothetical protein [Lentisphaerota bacterium]
MARRNRKKINGFVFPVPLAGIAVILMTLALVYVWLGCRCESVGKDIKKLEAEQISLKKKCHNEELRWAQMKSPRNIEKSLARNGLVMTWPRRDQVVRLYDAELFDDGPALRVTGRRSYAGMGRIAMHE